MIVVSLLIVIALPLTIWAAAWAFIGLIGLLNTMDKGIDYAKHRVKGNQKATSI